MPTESLTTAKLSTCYHTTNAADQSLGFLYSLSYLCPSVVSCLILNLLALWDRQHFLPCLNKHYVGVTTICRNKNNYNN